jgi:ketosteroid isomerase-like protein
MKPFDRNRITLGVIALVAGTFLTGCAAPAANKAAADETAAAWAAAFNAGDAAKLSALYAEDAHSIPPGNAAITGRSAIEAYWRRDFGTGGVITKLTPHNSIAQGDLLHVDGMYEVAAKDGISLAKGQYQQLWQRVDGEWKVQDEIWRLEPSLQRDPEIAERLASQWTRAYNAGDAAGLSALYDNDAELTTEPSENIVGRNDIGSFWKEDFGGGKPETKLAMTDAYMAGDLAHLEGTYEVTDKGTVTKGRYVQLWMQDGDGWRIRREIWWRQ